MRDTWAVTLSNQPVEDEAELVRAAQQDARDFLPLYERYRDRLYGYLLSRTGDPDAAADLLQRLDEQDRNTQSVTVGTSTVRVLSYQSMPMAKAPAGIFDYIPPPRARVQHCNNATPPACTIVHPSRQHR